MMEHYTSSLLRCEEYKIFAQARRAVIKGNQSYCKVDPRALMDCFVELDKARAELARVTEANRWIPVGERLPSDEGYFEVVLSGNYICDCHCFWVNTAFQGPTQYFEIGWYPINTNIKIDNVTHWRPPPAPPE